MFNFCQYLTTVSSKIIHTSTFNHYSYDLKQFKLQLKNVNIYLENMDSASYVSRGPPPFLHAHLTHLSCRQMQHLRPKCLRSYLRGKVVAKVAPTTQHTLPTKVSTKFTGSGGSSVGTVRL
jgi:hypothetical protein